MAISPRSKGLGNIGSIVNRQGMASPTRPTRPAPKPAPKLAPAPLARPVAQRQPMNPFKSATAPMVNQNPIDQQPMMPMMPQPAPELFNPNPNPGQLPIDNSGMNMFGGMQPQMQPMNMFGNMNPMVDYGGMNTGGMQPMPQPINMFGGMNPNVDYGGMYGAPTVDINGPAGMQPGQMFGAPTVDYGGPAGQQPMFGNPNPMASDYDELEGPGFNTNPSMGGSLFGGGGFSGR